MTFLGSKFLQRREELDHKGAQYLTTGNNGKGTFSLENPSSLSKATLTLPEANVAANGVGGTVTVTRVLWGDAEMRRSVSPPFDVVIAADVAAVVYEDAFDDLVACLRGGCGVWSRGLHCPPIYIARLALVPSFLNGSRSVLLNEI